MPTLDVPSVSEFRSLSRIAATSVKVADTCPSAVASPAGTPSSAPPSALASGNDKETTDMEAETSSDAKPELVSADTMAGTGGKTTSTGDQSPNTCAKQSSRGAVLDPHGPIHVAGKVEDGKSTQTGAPTKNSDLKEDTAESEDANVKCELCSLDSDDANMLLCDDCNKGYHLYCLEPPLVKIPAGTWFCPPCTAKQKQSSRFCGVTYDKEGKKWRAQIKHCGQKKSLGHYDNEADAAKAFDEAARKLRGETVHGGGKPGGRKFLLNFPTAEEIKKKEANQTAVRSAASSPKVALVSTRTRGEAAGKTSAVSPGKSDNRPQQVEALMETATEQSLNGKDHETAETSVIGIKVLEESLGNCSFEDTTSKPNHTN